MEREEVPRGAAPPVRRSVNDAVHPYGYDGFGVLPALNNQVVEPEDEPGFEDDALDVGAGAGDDDASGVEPDSLFAGAFSDPVPAPSLAWPSLCFAWLGSFSLLE